MSVTRSTLDPAIVASFHALSDPLRLKILELLRERELCVCELCDLLHVPQSKLSFHLKALRIGELVQTRQDGRWIYYRLNLSQLTVLSAYLTDFCHHNPALPARQCLP
jgi:ArsR family transcriptional regulator, arsenate/arsenite/antimonite-responsive transcriptional repressor